MGIFGGIQSAFGATKQFTVDHSPQILMTTGVLSVVAGVAWTIKNNVRAAGILEERKMAIEQLEELQANNDEGYSEDELANDIRKVNVSTTIGLVKTYGGPILTIASGIAQMSLGFNEMSNRYDGAMAWGTGVLGAFMTYRGRTRELYGEEADKKIMYGIENRKVDVIEEVDGKEKHVKKELPVAENPFGVSRYAVYFDRDTTGEWEENMDMNEGFIMGCQGMANDRLQHDKKRRVLTLNEVYQMLDVDQTIEGNNVGWSLNNKDGDGQVIFNVMRVARPDFDGADTYHECFLIDFNVDGPINRFLGKYNFDKAYLEDNHRR